MALYVAGARGVRGTAGVLWRPANGDERHQREGARAQCVGGSCPRSRTSTGGRGEEDKGTSALWLLAATCPCSLRHLRHRREPGRGQGRWVGAGGVVRQSSASSGSSTRRTEALALPRAGRTHARHRVLTRSPPWHGQDDVQALPNLVYALVHTVFNLGTLITHSQAVQT